MISATNHRIFQFMFSLELAKCVKYKFDTIVCNRPQQWLTNQISELCEWNLFNHNSDNGCNMVYTELQNVFLEMNRNKWIFVVPNITKMTAFCDNEAIHDELQGEGILELNQKCTLSIKNIQLDSNRVFDESDNEIIVPKVDHSVLLEIQSNDLDYSKHDFIQSNFTELRDMLKDAGKNHIHNLNRHDIHHYSAVYLIITLGLIYFGIKIIIKNKERIPNVLNQSNAPVPAVRRIPMPTLSGRENVAMQNIEETLYASAT